LSYPIKLTVAGMVLALMTGGCSTRSPSYGGWRGSAAPSQPRSSKAIHRATMRPYTINGKTYYPTVVRVGWTQRGVASWYGPDFHGGKTSNGETYNMYALTAAHKTLPMNTMVRVTNLRNARSVVVRINDRGPFVKGRIIDLSYEAGRRIGIDKTGTAPVKLTVLGFDSLIAAKAGAKGVRQKVTAGRFGVQVGAFRRREGAELYKKRYDGYKGRYRAVVRAYTVGGRPLYRVWLMGFRSEEEAKDFIQTRNIPGAYIIRD